MALFREIAHDLLGTRILQMHGCGLETLGAVDIYLQQPAQQLCRGDCGGLRLIGFCRDHSKSSVRREQSRRMIR
jgi:hypothetical protein